MENKTNARSGTTATGVQQTDAEMIDKDNALSINPSFDFSIIENPAQEGVTPQAIVEDAVKATAPPAEITGEDLLLRKVEHIPCLVEPFLQQTGLACLAGSSDTGKSTILRQLAIRVAMGGSRFLGWTLNTRYKSAICVITEDDTTAISFLLKKQTQGSEPESLKNLRFIFDTENLLVELNARLSAKPADLVIIDCFADAYGNDLKDSQKIRAYLNQCQALAEKHDCLFLFLHHTGKRTENFEPNKNNLLSGQGFEAKMRLVIELRADPARADQRHLCIVKGNYLAAEHKRESYVLNFDPDTFTFKETDERTPFEMLAKKPEDDDKAKFEQAVSLIEQDGKPYAEVAKILGYSSKGSVTKLLKRHGYQKGDGLEEPAVS